MTEQSERLQKTHNRQILDQVEDSSSSLICLRDSASFSTSWTSTTEGSSKLDMVFDFDSEILKSRFYQGQVRSLIRRALRRGKNKSDQYSMSSGTTLKEAKLTQKRSDEIDKMISRGRRASASEVKLLLLGPSKSAFLELMKLTLGYSYTSDERQSFGAITFNIVIQGMQDILRKMESSSIPLQDPKVQVHARWLFEYLRWTEGNTVPSEAAHVIQALWKDEGIKSYFAECRGNLEVCSGV